MTVDPLASSSRRAVIAGAVGAVAASFLSALGRPAQVDAANGQPTLLGATNAASATTRVNTSVGDGIYGYSTASNGRGAVGYVTHASGTTYGVYGRSNSSAGTGVYGNAAATSGFVYGVYGTTSSPAGNAIRGEAPHIAIRAEQTGPTGGVAMYAVSQATSGQGVGVMAFAKTVAGYGVYGSNSAPSGPAVGIVGRADSPDGIGVRGYAPSLSGNRTGVLGETQGGGGGTGVLGRAGQGGAAVRGENGSGTAVMGLVGAGVNAFVPPNGTGVYGRVFSAYASTGVEGRVDVGNGVRGESASGTGVFGTSNQSGYGVLANSEQGVALRAYSNAAGRVGAIVNSDAGSTGIFGYSGPNETDHPEFTGVYGYAYWGGTADVGVAGKTPSGTGVVGVSGHVGVEVLPVTGGNVGVYGRSDGDASSRGVHGHSAAGTGVYARTTSGSAVNAAASAAGGFALKTSGRISFAKISGVATIGAGALATSAIPTGTNIVSTSYVLLTPQGDPGTRRFWATKDTASDTITLHTNVIDASPMSVAWLLVG